MSYPISPATKVNLDAAADDPSQARAELVFLIDRFNELLGLLTTAPGVNKVPVTDAASALAIAGTIYANAVGSGLRVKADGTDAKDGGIWAGSDGTIYVGNRSSTRGLKIPPSGDLLQTINGNSVWHTGNDGAGSALDAGLLAGHDPSYYINTGNIGGQTVQKATAAPYARSESGLRIIRGEVNDNGTIKHGSGFTVSGSTPTFTITWTNAFTEAPTVIATTGTYVFVRDDAGPYTTSWSCSTVLSNNNGAASGGFRFIAIGKD